NKNLIDTSGNFKVSGTLDINGKAFTIGEENEYKTINELVSAINNEDLGLRAAYDKTLGRLMINTKEMGEDQVINIIESIDNGDLSTKFFGKDINETGQNAIVHLNGQQINDLKANNLSIFGMNLQLQAADKTREITLKVESN